MAKRAATIRADLYELVTAQLFKYGVDNFVDFHRQHPNVQLFDDPLCPWVNCLCPDDLCYLPAGHVGTEEGYHITGTTNYEFAIRFQYKDMAEVGTPRLDLIKKGHQLARQRFPEEFPG